MPNCTHPTDRIGVWISGFFGAGKSHFAKMLGYLLENRAVGGQTARELFAARLAGSSRRTELEGLLHRAGLLDSRVVTFQIKAEQDLTNKDDSISEIMYRSYLVSRGLSKSLTVAGLELSLIERGLYDAFRAEVERRTGRPWAEEREDFLFIRPTVAEALQAVAPAAYRSREEALAALDLIQRSQGLSVSDLGSPVAITWMSWRARATLNTAAAGLHHRRDGPVHRRYGQKLLELQSIAEEFASHGRGKLWLIVTSQAKLDELIAGVKAKQADFSKIGQRFDIRLALTADDVEKVLEGRILKKRTSGRPRSRPSTRRTGALAALGPARREPQPARAVRRAVRCQHSLPALPHAVDPGDLRRGEERHSHRLWDQSRSAQHDRHGDGGVEPPANGFMQASWDGWWRSTWSTTGSPPTSCRRITRSRPWSGGCRAGKPTTAGAQGIVPAAAGVLDRGHRGHPGPYAGARCAGDNLVTLRAQSRPAWSGCSRRGTWWPRRTAPGSSSPALRRASRKKSPA